MGRLIHHRRGDQARRVQAGERKRRSLHQCLEHTTATSLLSLEFRDICTSIVLAFTISRNNKGVCFTCLFFGNFLDPRGLGSARTQRYAWLYPRQSRASLGGYYGGDPRTSPKIANVFRNISVSPLSFSYPWKKRTRGVSNYGTGPAESWGRLRLRDTAPPSPPHAYVAYEREIPCRHLSKSHTRTRK